MIKLVGIKEGLVGGGQRQRRRLIGRRRKGRAGVGFNPPQWVLLVRGDEVSQGRFRSSYKYRDPSPPPRHTPTDRPVRFKRCPP